MRGKEIERNREGACVDQGLARTVQQAKGKEVYELRLNQT